MVNIFVSNLSFKFNEDSLNQLFQQYGTVNSSKIITDKFTGKSRGFGFVEMANDEEGHKAIEALNESEHDGRNISVSVAKPRTEGGGGRDRNSGGGGYGGGRRDNDREKRW
ncbi:MAG TPA: RNA-binding protein [Bacteroidia bacterium]|jgi:RNA recognition motif-containing protein|nr:RNA-binding protein [Bacteroidia bacterium]